MEDGEEWDWGRWVRWGDGVGGLEWWRKGEWLAFAVLSERDGGVNVTTDHETRERLKHDDGRVLEWDP